MNYYKQCADYLDRGVNMQKSIHQAIKDKFEIDTAILKMDDYLGLIMKYRNQKLKDKGHENSQAAATHNFHDYTMCTFEATQQATEETVSKLELIIDDIS